MVIFNIGFLTSIMNYIDMFILILLIYAVFRGYTRGFILQLTILAALGFGIFAALKLSDFTAEKLKGHLSMNPETLHLVAMGITFILVFLAVRLVGNLVEKMVESMELSPVNRLLGILFSAVKILFICGVLLVFIDRIDRRIPFLPKDSREHSLFFKPLNNVITTVFTSMHIPGTDYEGVKVQV
jgi:membrane protein required for colicin V production